MDINRMSREKLLKAGYKFIRMTDYPCKDGVRLQIRYCDNTNFVWKLLGTYSTKAEREREAKRLIEEEPYLIY